MRWDGACYGGMLLVGAMEKDEGVWPRMSVYYGFGFQEAILLVIKVCYEG